MKIIKRNAAKCNKCGDIIESTHRHDFKWCSCRTVAVDGGLEYIKRCFKSEGDYTDLSETIYDDIKKIYCIQGLTSSGKTTITERVSKELNIPVLISHTTRPIREGIEENGKTYHFVDNNFFNENEFLEQRHYNTEYGVWKYGLHISELQNKPYSLFIVDRQGYEELQDKLGEDKLVSIFIEVSEEELKRRNKLRGDCPKEFSRRLKSDIEEFKGHISDYIVYNNNLEDAVKKVKEIIIINEMSELEI